MFYHVFIAILEQLLQYPHVCIAISPVRIRGGVPKSGLLVVLGGPRGVFRLPLGTLWSPFGLPWAPFGLLWAALGVPWGVLWDHFGPPEGYLEGLWWFFWMSLGSFGPPFAAFGVLLAMF